MAKTREEERAELYKTLWNIANQLRGSVDGWDFKQYVLGMIFYRYVSEKICAYIDKGEHEAGREDFSYAALDDETAETIKDEIVSECGFFIVPSELFCNMQKKAKGNENLNEDLHKVFKNIEASAMGTPSQENFAGLFADLDVSSPKLGNNVVERNKKLVNLLNAVGDMDLGVGAESNIDAFGDAYEFLMTMYATYAGKSGGEFFTPQEVSRLLTLIALDKRKKVSRVYDPACGSGSLLLQTSKIIGLENVEDGFYGQEINLTTYNLCRINMFLHDVPYEKFHIALGDTLVSPETWSGQKMDVIVSNPPYSLKWEGADNATLLSDERFTPAGVLAPKSKADFAFNMHILSMLSSDGVAAVVSFPGIMYRSGAEQKIRKYLIDNNFVEAVIQLPDNLFFGTSIATCILVLKKNKKDNTVTFIDASKEFIKVTNSNKLSEENIQNILRYYEEHKDVDHLVKVVSAEDIAKEKYNLSVSTYVEPYIEKEEIDFKELVKEWNDTANKVENLRKDVLSILSEIGGLLDDDGGDVCE